MSQVQFAITVQDLITLLMLPKYGKFIRKIATFDKARRKGQQFPKDQKEVEIFKVSKMVSVSYTYNVPNQR